MKYRVFLSYQGTATVDVEAATEEEALEKAGETAPGQRPPEPVVSGLIRQPEYDRVRMVLQESDLNYNFAMSRILKPGRAGNFEIKLDIIPAGQAFARYDRSGRISIGEYGFDYPIAALMEDDKVWMSDSPLEVESYKGAVELAKGDCLVSGLGIGLLPTLIEQKANRIDIVELNRDVVDLVYPQIRSEKTRVIRDDIFHYLDTTDKKYDFIHVDIWGDITAPMLEIEKAREKAQRCLYPGGAAWCWLEEIYIRIKDKLPEGPVKPGKFGRYEPCLICGNRIREDYGGLCAVCAGEMGITDRYM